MTDYDAKQEKSRVEKMKRVREIEFLERESKPAVISDELAIFLRKDKGTTMTWCNVNNELNRYVRSHNLYDKMCGRKLIPDANLIALFKLTKNEESSFTCFKKGERIALHLMYDEEARTLNLFKQFCDSQKHI